jgi:hypothetical protein
MQLHRETSAEFQVYTLKNVYFEIQIMVKCAVSCSENKTIERIVYTQPHQSKICLYFGK